VIPDARLRVLIVDDDALLRMSLLHTLTHAGHKVRSADSGLAALAEIGREIPDLLLSDLNMPGLSGFELLSVVRRRFPAIQVIAMSGAFFGDGVPPGVFADAF
jgi:CheY-like chemotaxis protein